MADIFQEVEDDLKKDKAAAFWKRYGSYILIVAGLLVLAMAGYQGWQAYELDQRQKASDAYATALALAADETQQPQALAALSELSGGGGSYAVLASFEEARILVETGNTEAAVAVWERIAQDAGAANPFGDVAVLLSVMHQIESGDPSTLKTRLQPLAQPGKAFQASAKELLAAIALQENDRAEARRLFTELSDDLGAPAGIRARAAQMIEALKE